jgi:hypothetical protein
MSPDERRQARPIGTYGARGKVRPGAPIAGSGATGIVVKSVLMCVGSGGRGVTVVEGDL